MKSDYDSIIIGAGCAGLAYAALLAKHGKKVLVLEKNGYVGGRWAKTTARALGICNSNDAVSYGPHILPANGYAEWLLDYLGIKHELKLKKLALPAYFKNRLLSLPGKLSIRSLPELYKETEFMSFSDKVAYIKLFKLAFYKSEGELIREFQKMSCEKLAGLLGMGDEGKALLAAICGSYCLNDDLKSCPALDLLINLKLFAKGMQKSGTIMYYAENSLTDELASFIKRHGGKIILDAKVDKLATKGDAVVGVAAGRKKIYAKQVVFTAPPAEFRSLLRASGLSPGFLGGYKEAMVFDFLFKTRKRIFRAQTTWVCIPVNDKQWGFVVIEEPTNGGYCYHACYIKNGKKIGEEEALAIMKRKMTEIFGVDFSEAPLTEGNTPGLHPRAHPRGDKDVVWSASKNLRGYGARKDVKNPFGKQTGPETPYENLFCIGDSYKALTVGIDGCMYSALNLCEKILGKKHDKENVFRYDVPLLFSFYKPGIKEKELLRKMIHTIYGVLMAGILFFNTRQNAISLAAAIFLLGLVLSELSRRKIHIGAISSFLHFCERPEHILIQPGHGPLQFTMGALLAMLLFDKPTALASILVLSVADSASTIIGMNFGKHKHSWPFSAKKTVEGSLAGFLTSLIILVNFVSPTHAFMVAAITAILEALSLPVDDNLVLPVGAGAMIYLLKNYATS